MNEVGPAVVGGVPTTEYRGTIDLSKVLGQAAGAAPGTGTGGSGGSSLSQGLAQAFGLGAIPVSVWVDNDGRARQVTVNMAIFGIHLDMALGPLRRSASRSTRCPRRRPTRWPTARRLAPGRPAALDILKSATSLSA